MSGKLHGAFEIKYINWTDPNGNTVKFPIITAITMTLSFLSIFKTCVNLNLQWIHVKEGSNFYTYAEKAFVYIPFFAATAVFRFSSIR